MQNAIAEIKFFFPSISDQIQNGGDLANCLFDLVKSGGDFQFAGYLNEEDFKNNLKSTIGTIDQKDIKNSIVLNEEGKQNIKNIILNSLQVCHKALPHPDLPIFIFVYPWLPDQKENASFGGVMAFASYYTIHLFVNVTTDTTESIKKTIAHEWNHLVYFYYQQQKEFTVAQHIVMEGLAEVFREEIIGGKPAPWSTALSEEDARETLLKIVPILESTDDMAHRELFFENKKYKRWTGYSIGYYFIKKIKKENPNISWTQLVTMDTILLLKKGAQLN